MTYPRQLFRHPGPYGLGKRSYAVAGAADEHEEQALLKKGWSLTLEEALNETGNGSGLSAERGEGLFMPLPGDGGGNPCPSLPASVFDHDGDGAPGGSVAPEKTDDLANLRAEYTEKMGKKPFPGWDADEIRKRMAA